MIQLVRAEDCIRKTRFRNSTNNNWTNDKKGLELISKEDCSTIQNSCARIKKKTKQEIGWAIRIGDIPIPEEDKRYSCKYYEKENRSCSVYKQRHCTTCIKK